MKPVRFLPLVALAAFSLLALKLAGMMMGERYMITGTQQSAAKAVPDEKQDIEEPGKEKPKKTTDKGSLAPKRIGAKKEALPPKDITSLLGEDYRSKAEINLLMSLSKRREQLDRRESEMALRLNLIKAAEKRVNERITVLKGLEVKIQRFAKIQKDEKTAQFNRLVKMYSAMKPKGAALIFNDLDAKVLLGIIQKMKPQAMSAILAAMAPEKARELTISLAGSSRQKFTEKNLDDLPKINGN